MALKKTIYWKRVALYKVGVAPEIKFHWSMKTWAWREGVWAAQRAGKLPIDLRWYISFSANVSFFNSGFVPVQIFYFQYSGPIRNTEPKLNPLPCECAWTKCRQTSKYFLPTTEKVILFLQHDRAKRRFHQLYNGAQSDCLPLYPQSLTSNHCTDE